MFASLLLSWALIPNTHIFTRAQLIHHEELTDQHLRLSFYLLQIVFIRRPLLTVSCSASGIFLLGSSTVSSSSDCDVFEESKLCMSQLTNLLDRQPTEDEVVCQELCQSNLKCQHFTFMESKYPLKTGEPDFQCYLWQRCDSKVSQSFSSSIYGLDRHCHCPTVFSTAGALVVVTV